jgi:hypothetical protein
MYAACTGAGSNNLHEVALGDASYSVLVVC